MAMGLVGPIARAVGIPYDVRKTFPYLKYDTFDFEVPTATEGDVFARYTVKLEEMRQSVKICHQALDAHFADRRIRLRRLSLSCRRRRIACTRRWKRSFSTSCCTRRASTCPKGECYVPVEGPRGEHGFYIVSDGTNRPMRIKSRAPSFIACQALRKDGRRRTRRGSHRGDRIDGRRDGRRGSMSFHPAMDYGRGRHQSARQLPEEGPDVRLHARRTGRNSTRSARGIRPSSASRRSSRRCISRSSSRGISPGTRCGTWPRPSGARRRRSRTSCRSTRCSTRVRSADTCCRCAGRCRAR